MHISKQLDSTICERNPLLTHLIKCNALPMPTKEWRDGKLFILVINNSKLHNKYQFPSCIDSSVAEISHSIIGRSQFKFR